MGDVASFHQLCILCSISLHHASKEILVTLLHIKTCQKASKITLLIWLFFKVRVNYKQRKIVLEVQVEKPHIQLFLKVPSHLSKEGQEYMYFSLFLWSNQIVLSLAFQQKYIVKQSNSIPQSLIYRVNIIYLYNFLIFCSFLHNQSNIYQLNLLLYIIFMNIWPKKRQKITCVLYSKNNCKF